jgi:hypothetical protein
VFALWRFIHLRRILRLAAMTRPPSCGVEPFFFAVLVFSLFVHACFAINVVSKRRVRLLPAPLSIHFREPRHVLNLRSNAELLITPASASSFRVASHLHLLHPSSHHFSSVQPPPQFQLVKRHLHRW